MCRRQNSDVLSTLESQSHPKIGVARTEARDITRKATAIFVIGKSRLVERNGDKVACIDMIMVTFCEKVGATSADFPAVFF